MLRKNDDFFQLILIWVFNWTAYCLCLLEDFAFLQIPVMSRVSMCGPVLWSLFSIRSCVGNLLQWCLSAKETDICCMMFKHAEALCLHWERAGEEWLCCILKYLKGWCKYFVSPSCYMDPTVHFCVVFFAFFSKEITWRALPLDTRYISCVPVTADTT